jgi:hypothetical protein
LHIAQRLHPASLDTLDADAKVLPRVLVGRGQFEAAEFPLPKAVATIRCLAIEPATQPGLEIEPEKQLLQMQY